MKYFLIAYNRRSGMSEIKRVFTAADRASAMRARFALEQGHQAEPDIEVVVLGAESTDELKTTHARYFMRAGDLLSRADALVTK